MTHSIDRQIPLEMQFLQQRKERTPARTFHEGKIRWQGALQDKMTAALKEKLSREKEMLTNQNGEVPLQAPLISPSSSLSPACSSWQPSKEVLELFEKMADSLSHIDQNGIRMTTVTLGKEFSSSLFHHCTIEIKEYSTAPKVFNIIFGAATAEALKFFAPHAEAMQNAINRDHVDFQIERLDVELLDPRDQQEEQQGQGQDQ